MVLTEKEVLYLRRWFGVFIEIHNGRHPEGAKAMYVPGTLDVHVYLPSICSEEEFNETLVHELIHVRDDLMEDEEPQTRVGYLQGEGYFNFDKTELEKKWDAMKGNNDDTDLEQKVIAETRETCEKDPRIIGYIKEVFGITYSSK